MRAVRCCDREIQVIDVPEPTGEGLRLHVKSAGICGSDLHLLEFSPTLANTLGHEFAGVLDDGRPVAVEPLLACGTCDLCREGRYNLCRLGSGIIMGIGHDGGMTDQVMVPERCIVPLAEATRLADASLVEPLAVAVHGIRAGGVSAGERIAVVGGGSIGLSALAVCRGLGAEAAVVARHAHQVEAARDLGGVEIEGEYPFVIDCAGTRESLAQAVDLCRPGGTLILLATYWHGMEMPGMALCLKEVRVVPSSLYNHRHETSDFQFAADLLGRYPDVAQVMITHRLPLDDARRAFEIAADRQAGAIKVVLEV